MEEIFEPILDDNEKVLKVIKPNKFIMYFKTMFLTAMWFVVMFAFMLIGIVSSTLEEPEFYPPIGITILVVLGICAGLILVTILIEWLFLHLYYKNVYYGYTNKRIVIRKGIFGVDYKSLDIKMIGASTVNVSLLDKIIRKNTGTIHYGSMASPMNGANAVNNFILSHVNDPYGLYKEIKSYISSVNDGEESKPEAKKATRATTKKTETKEDK